VPLWLQVGIGVLTFLTLLGAFWSKVVRPLARFVGTADRAAPALEQIAIDFPDGGSLKGRIVDIESSLLTLVASSGRCEELLVRHVQEHHDQA
jgi:hypothetical protein